MSGLSGALDLEQRDKLIEEYQGYVGSTARKLIRYMGLPQERYDDFVSAGYLGLVEAATRYDPRSNDNFQNYAFLRIRGAIIDSIRDDSELKRVAYKRAQALSAAHELRMEEFNRTEGGTSSESGGSSLNSLSKILDVAAKTALVHRLTFCDVEPELEDVEGAPKNPEQLLERKQSDAQLHELLATLSETERLVLENFYFKDMSFTDIAQKHAGLSKSWISRVHDKALELLKKRMLQPRRPRTVANNANALAKPKKSRRGRPPTLDRRLSRADPDQPDRKRRKQSPRTIRGGRVSGHQKPTS